jgi:peptide/nickel transport system substrate-binding protein
MRKRLISVLSVGALLVAACSTSSTPSPLATLAPTAVPTPVPTAVTPATPTPVPTAVPIALTGSTYVATPAGTTGGSIVLAEWQYPDTINPYFAQAETDIEVSGSMFDGLLNVTPDLKYVPDLATNVPTVDNGGVVLTSAGGMDVTWTLRAGMKWSDGQPINCNDIQATWKWVMDPANTGLAGGTTGWEDISGVDGGTDTNCVIHFSKVYEGYLSLVSPVLPAHYITSISVADAPTKLYPLTNLSSGVYSGAYIPTDARADAQITLVPNANWSTIGGHAPYLASVIWKYYGTSDAMIQGFKAGEYDLGQDLQNADIPSLVGIDPAQQVIHDSLTYELNAFNKLSLTTKYGADAVTIINAVKLATDRQAIAKGPLGGNVTVTNNFISPLTWYYKDEGGSTAADPATATSLLTAAGWTKGSDGYLAKGGKTLELQYCTTTKAVRGDTLKLIASQLKAIGIKADTTQTPNIFAGWNDVPATTPCVLIHGTYDVAEFAYVSPLDPLGGYNVYNSVGIPDAAPHNGQNVTRTSIPALDAAYNAVKSSVDFAKVRQSMFTVQDIYVSSQNTYELPLYNRKDVWLVNPKLHNFTGNPTTSAGEWNIGDWWVG